MFNSFCFWQDKKKFVEYTVKHVAQNNLRDRYFLLILVLKCSSSMVIHL